MGTQLFVAGRGETMDVNESGFREARVELSTFTHCNSQVKIPMISKIMLFRHAPYRA